MEIDHCVFPDDLLYDLENNTWLRIEDNGEVTVGVTSVLPAIAGKLTIARLKLAEVVIQRGQSLGTLESLKFVGPIPSPVSGILLKTNGLIVDRPRIINDSPYQEGWIASLKPSHLALERILLSKSTESKILLVKKIAEFHVRCFKAFPDHEMSEIGTECSAVLIRLNDLLATIPVGEVVHLVSDDQTAYVEMVAWSERTGQNLLDWRQEGNLFHFVVKKVR
ncbi:MAG TPA: sulfurtransferase TusA family protein [Candidatus Limnocylindrales bacterium]|nr:sulfurtransferase TusA family protein [Candidatus Limnocylindrales bacterium]